MVFKKVKNKRMRLTFQKIYSKLPLIPVLVEDRAHPVQDVYWFFAWTLCNLCDSCVQFGWTCKHTRNIQQVYFHADPCPTLTGSIIASSNHGVMWGAGWSATGVSQEVGKRSSNQRTQYNKKLCTSYTNKYQDDQFSTSGFERQRRALGRLSTLNARPLFAALSYCRCTWMRLFKAEMMETTNSLHVFGTLGVCDWGMCHLMAGRNCEPGCSIG